MKAVAAGKPVLRPRGERVLFPLIAAYVAACGLAGAAIVALGAVPPWHEGSPFEFIPGTAAMLLGIATVLAYVLGSPSAGRPLRWRGAVLGLLLFLVGLEEAVALHELLGSERLTDGGLWVAIGVVLWTISRRAKPSTRATFFIWAAWIVHGLSVLADGDEMTFALSRAAATGIDEFLEFSYVPLYALAVLCLPAAPGAGKDTAAGVDASFRPSLVGAAERVGLVIWGQLSFGLFKARHPHATFADFYARDIAKKLDHGAAHPTLGKRKRIRRTGQTLDLTRAKHATRGRFALERLFVEGLRPEHRVVDYGCGSLRVGQHFIAFLDPDHYWGLDVTDRFYRDGLELMSPGLAADRRPNLAVIDDTVLRQVAAQQIDFIVCVAVLLHVPPGELAFFLQRLLGLRAPHTVVALWFDETDMPVRTQAKAWAYPRSAIIGEVRRIDPHADCTVEPFDDVAHRYGGLPVSRSILWIRPDPGSAQAGMTSPIHGEPTRPPA